MYKFAMGSRFAVEENVNCDDDELRPRFVPVWNRITREITVRYSQQLQYYTDVKCSTAHHTHEHNTKTITTNYNPTIAVIYTVLESSFENTTYHCIRMTPTNEDHDHPKDDTPTTTNPLTNPDPTVMTHILPPPSHHNNNNNNNVVPEHHRHMNDTTMPPPSSSTIIIMTTTTPQSNARTNSNTTTTTNITHTSPTTIAMGPPTSRQQRQRTTGSSTKTAFGLTDWMRLLSVSKDIAQLKGRGLRTNITIPEVRQHHTIHDGWIILQNTRVYNLSPYLMYHPGGSTILKSVLGKDATLLFHQYHSWVNADGYVGVVVVVSHLTF